MDSGDTEMTEADAAPAPPGTSPPPAQQALNPNSHDFRELLAMARQLIDQGKPSHALQLVVFAVKTRGGDEAAFQILNRAREQFRSKVQASAAANELASLFAECAIAEAMPSKVETSQQEMHAPSIELDALGNSILAETGRKQIMLDAFSDGSSFVCLQCGGLVSNQRKDEHYTFWCCGN